MDAPESIYVREIGHVRHQGKRWILGTSGDLLAIGKRGLCMTPKDNSKPGAIIISDHLPASGPMFLEAVIHESLHVAYPKKSEGSVVSAAHLLAKVLTRFSYIREIGK